MAQDVTVAGAAYSDVPAVALPATGGGTASFYDVSATTATAEDVASGKTFYSASGALTTGTASGGGDGVGVFYGTCATAAATAAKAVVCEEFTSDHLVEGTVVIVKFTNAQTYNGAPTLNVQSTGAKNIKRIGTTNAARYEWQAGEVLQFVYDGTYWVLTDGGIATTTYYGVTKLSSATNSTSTALAATASAVKAAYDLANGKQDALVSGTNIKTVNGQSLLGAGDVDTSYTLPTASTTTLGGVKVDGETITISDGVISAAGSGSGISYNTQTISISASAWSGTTATAASSIVTADNDIIVAPAPASIAAWAAAGIYCSAQADGTLTFTCSTAPTEAVSVNIMAFEGGSSVEPPAPSSYSVTITTTNPKHSGEADSIPCKLYESENGTTLDGSNLWALGNQIGSMGHTDTTTVEVDKELFGIVAVFNDDCNAYVADSGVTCTGGVSNGGARSSRVLLKVDGDGTATINGVNYDW